MFGQSLKECRERAGLTQQQLADKLFKSRTAISKMENNEQEIGVGTFKDWLVATNCELHTMAILFGTEIFNQATQAISLLPAFISAAPFFM